LTLASDLSVLGTASITSNLTVAGNTQITGTASVTSNLTVGGFIKPSLGYRSVNSYSENNGTFGSVFTAMESYIPNVGDEMLITGGRVLATAFAGFEVYSRAWRYTTAQIAIVSMYYSFSSLSATITLNYIYSSLSVIQPQIEVCW
jgi:hypothetical protein